MRRVRAWRRGRGQFHKKACSTQGLRSGIMERMPFVVLLTAWLCPGLGHLILRRPAKAAWFGGLILGTFALGLWLGDGHSVSTARFPYHAWGQHAALLPAWLADTWLGSRAQGATQDRLELGVVFTTVAGIMNIVAIVDAYEIARTRRRAA